MKENELGRGKRNEPHFIPRDKGGPYTRAELKRQNAGKSKKHDKKKR